MTDYYDLFPELNILLGDVFKPELEKILLFYKRDKVFFRLFYSESSGIQSIEEDLSFVVKHSSPMFKTDYSLEENAMEFFNLCNLSLLNVIGEAFSEDGVEKLLEG
jgi:hypothetical protein